MEETQEYIKDKTFAQTHKKNQVETQEEAQQKKIHKEEIH